MNAQYLEFALTWGFIHLLQGLRCIYGEKNLWSAKSEHKTKTAETTFHKHWAVETPSKSIQANVNSELLDHHHMLIFKCAMYRLAYMEKQIKFTHLKDHLMQNGLQLTSPYICHLSGIRYARHTPVLIYLTCIFTLSVWINSFGELLLFNRQHLTHHGEMTLWHWT